MLTFQGLYERFQKITSDDSTDNVTFGKALINETQKLVCSLKNWSFAEETNTSTSSAGQQSVKLPVNYRRLITVNVTSGGVKYTPSEVSNQMTFDKLNAQGTSVTSDFPSYFHIREGALLLYPAISSASLTITTVSLIRPIDMTAADYTTGTVSAIANGAVAITGSGTTWTAAMVGRYIRITSEGQWYKIATRVSDTAITIDKPYEGTTIAAGSEAYTIGQLPIVPEEFEDLLWLRPVAIYYMMKGEETKSNFYMKEYKDMLIDLRNQYQSQTTQNAFGIFGELNVPNVNDYPLNIS